MPLFSPWYSLFHAHYYVYTQAIAWGGATSLAALVAVLRWQRTRHSAWLLLAGLATGLAVLSKPEFGITALAASSAALVVSRGAAGAWGRYLLASSLTVMIGFGLQAWSAGLWPVWRGYTGYDQLASGSLGLWGTRLGDRRILLGGYALWLAIAGLWAGRRWPRHRTVFFVATLAGGMTVFAVALSYLLGISDTTLLALLRRGDTSGIAISTSSLFFLVSLPWAPLLPVLLVAGWLARGRARLPAAWWVLLTYAAVSSLRFLLTGYANPFAVAPALAVFWLWIEDRLSETPEMLGKSRRVALAVLAGLAVTNLLAQVLIPNFLLNGPRVWVDTALGPVRIAQTYESEFEALTAFVDQRLPVDAPIFTTGWGAHWYLLTGRPNPTAFDAVFAGLGSRGIDAAGIQRDLHEQPPAALIVSERWLPETAEDSTGDGVTRRDLPGWWQTLLRDYVDRSPPEAQRWSVLLRQDEP